MIVGMIFLGWSALIAWFAFRAMIDKLASARAGDASTREKLDGRGNLNLAVAGAVFLGGIVGLYLLR